MGGGGDPNFIFPLQRQHSIKSEKNRVFPQTHVSGKIDIFPNSNIEGSLYYLLMLKVEKLPWFKQFFFLLRLVIFGEKICKP